MSEHGGDVRVGCLAIRKCLPFSYGLERSVPAQNLHLMSEGRLRILRGCLPGILVSDGGVGAQMMFRVTDSRLPSSCGFERSTGVLATRQSQAGVGKWLLEELLKDRGSSGQEDLSLVE